MADIMSWTPGEIRHAVEQSTRPTSPGDLPTSTDTPKKQNGTESSPTSPRAGHQRLVFTDPVAFRYLEEDPSTEVLDRRRRLEGYEIYLVEQWACSRVHPTFVIATYTGDPSHSILVSVLGVPTDESTWSTRLRVYFKAISQFHARKKETPIGTMMVTNLSGFPSALTVIAVPDGDVKKHREDFMVNEDLKRLGCSGRAGLTLQKPSSATEAKFHQLYRVSDRIPLYGAVMELVNLCQVALTIFAKLAPEYADGLLCDVTEKAINDWWTDIGTDYYNIEPSDGILGPTTVSALLGLLMGARNRLNAYGASIGKDAFDALSFKRGIWYFQKSQKLERTRRLDRQTLDKLHRVTAKAASSEGWTVPKAVKSTVAELSGKGGEMVMGMVGAREKAGIAEVETLDIDRFVQLVHGARAKWLWHGKPRKTGSGDIFDHTANDDGMVFSKDEQGGYVWASGKRGSGVDSLATRLPYLSQDTAVVQSPQTATDEKESQAKRNMLKSVTGRVNDARSGFGRFKDAVGLPGMRSHHQKFSKEDSGHEYEGGGGLSYQPTFGSEITLSTTRSGQPPSPALQAKIGKELDRRFKFPGEESKSKLAFADATPYAPLNEVADSEPEVCREDEGVGPSTMRKRDDKDQQGSGFLQIDGDKLDDLLLDIENSGQPLGPSLRKTQSSRSLLQPSDDKLTVPRWPRSLSFSAAEEALLPREDIGTRDLDGGVEEVEPEAALQRYRAAAIDAQHIADKIAELERLVKAWVESQVSEVDDLEQQAASHQEELKTLYLQRLEHCRILRAGTENLLHEDKTALADALREVEVLGQKLEYELDALQSRVQDVEDGVAEFERQVLDSEARVNELTQEKHDTASWASWLSGFVPFSRKSAKLGV